ncbi:ABC transporter substrate-binding protein [Vibrio agarivorans]|uniref:ABC transporter substrate-binding protein n=1 Tax=Vibrio agarivorans TaxID=153622 RepID=UPI0022303F76|nr:ABC transporter substrate-binding protein [Vibrio agarivorans]
MNKIIGLLLLSFVTSTQAEPLLVPGKPGEDKLMQLIFKEIVNRSDRFDSISHYYGNAGDPNTAKMIEDLDSGHLHITYVATSLDNESTMSPIYFPIYRGLLGMRLGIVRSDKANTFAGITRVDQLKSLTACQGRAWPDTDILEANGIKTAQSLKYPNMFPMLEGGRCDYFPRGVFEPFTEIVAQKQYNLTVDEYVMLRYKMPFFFFTAKNNPELATHIQEILYEMFEDGTYERMFFDDTEVAQALRLAKLQDRTIFDLENPSVSPATRNIPTQFWYDPLKGAQ